MYALVQWGPQKPGKRPYTVLAWISGQFFENHLAAPGRFTADIVSLDGTSRFDEWYEVPRSSILHVFGRELPTVAMVMAAKHAIPIQEQETTGNDWLCPETSSLFGRSARRH